MLLGNLKEEQKKGNNSAQFLKKREINKPDFHTSNVMPKLEITRLKWCGYNRKDIHTYTHTKTHTHTYTHTAELR